MCVYTYIYHSKCTKHTKFQVCTQTEKVEYLGICSGMYLTPRYQKVLICELLQLREEHLKRTCFDLPVFLTPSMPRVPRSWWTLQERSPFSPFYQNKWMKVFFFTYCFWKHFMNRIEKTHDCQYTRFKNNSSDPWLFSTYCESEICLQQRR